MTNGPEREPVFDVRTADFEATILGAAEEDLILVDFWAPWCAPCRTLGPALEGVVRDLGGAVRLARVNTDEEPDLAAAFEIRGIPAVKLFQGGRIIDEFTGALSADQIRAFLEPHMPSPAADLVARAERLAGDGNAGEAETVYREALERDPRNAQAQLGLGVLLIDAERSAEAVPLLEQAADTEDTAAEAKAVLSRVRFVDRCRGGITEDEARRRVASSSSDLAARLALGYCLAARGEFREALDRFLEIVDLDPQFDDEAGRKAMLEVFDAAGPRSDLSEEYRSRLARVLFR